MRKRYTIIIILTLIAINNDFCYSQSYREKLSDVFLPNGPSYLGNGSFSYQTVYSSSGSSWELDWDETNVFNALISVTNPSNNDQSYEMRIGKGGQIYSFINPVFGEALPPQWRPSFDTSGSSIPDQTISNPIISNHGNWASWNDEVWQLVGSDQRDSIAGSVKTQNIHMAGSYMNNFTHRASDHTLEPFYSPIVQSYYDSTEKSFSTIVWGQSEDPTYVYDAPEGCAPCYPELFRPSVLFFQKYKDLGQGVIQVDFLIYNYSRTRGIDFWNIPFTGIRNSSLPYAIISDDPVDGTSYEILNTKAGHPVADDPTTAVDESEGYLPEFSQGATTRVSGTNAVSSGWIAFSKDSSGAGNCLAFVTTKSSNNPVNAVGDLRYGTAMGNAIRDVTIFSRRAFGGPVDVSTGLKMWGIVGGQSIQGRYFIVVDSNIDSVVQQIQNRNLTTEAKVEIISIPYQPLNDIHYMFSNNGANIYSVSETDSSSAQFTFNSKPFDGSYPVYLISNNSESVLSSNPYYFSLRPYDGIVESIELLGYSSNAYNIQLNTTTLSNESQYLETEKLIMYPNPTSNKVNLVGNSIKVKDIKIYNIFGQEITSLTRVTSMTNDKITIDLSMLSSGMYFVKIKGTIANKVYKKIGESVLNSRLLACIKVCA